MNLFTIKQDDTGWVVYFRGYRLTAFKTYEEAAAMVEKRKEILRNS